MKIDYSRKNLAGIPYRGTAVSLSNSDVASIVAAGSGVVRSLAGAGAVGLGLALVVGGAMLSLAGETRTASRQLPKAPKIPIGQSLVYVQTPKRTFFGFCLDESTEFTCEDDSIKAPTAYLNRIIYNTYDDLFSIELIDGSVFHEVHIKSPLKFMSIVGIQKVNFSNWDESDFDEEEITIQGASISQVTELKNNLVEALNQNLEQIIEILGEDILSRFFKIQEIRATNTKL